MVRTRKSKPQESSETRRQILQAALEQFARAGYAATPVQQIVAAARVSKPALYYYFQDKAGLFGALVNQAHDERYRLISEGVARPGDTAGRLEDILVRVFDYSSRHRELMRLAFATAFAAPGEIPCRADCVARGRRNYDLVSGMMAAGQKAGELNRAFSPGELAMSFLGQLNMQVMVHLLAPEVPVNRQTARRIVQLFMAGAAPARRRRR